MNNYKPLAPELEPWFDGPIDKIPEHLRDSVESAYFLFKWHGLTADQRRHLAEQYDYSNDPGTESHRQYWFEMYSKLDDIQRQVMKWSSVEPESARDRVIQSSELDSLRNAEKSLKAYIRKLERRQFPRYKQLDCGESSRATDADQLVTFRKAFEILETKFGASKEEIAAWIFLGPNAGGFHAYRGREEARLFYFEPEMDCDYVALLHSCFFDEQVILSIIPEDRFLTGIELLAMLTSELGDAARTFLNSRIDDGTLVDIHPIKGVTDGGDPDLTNLPGVETGLFSVAQIREMQLNTGLNACFPPRLVDSDKRNESPAVRKQRLHEWYDEESSKEPRGALKRTAARENITHQTLKKILDRQK